MQIFILEVYPIGFQQTDLIRITITGLHLSETVSTDLSQLKVYASLILLNGP